jgi:hypothetical protein
MAVLNNEDIIADGFYLISSQIGAWQLSNCFCFLFLLFEAAASIVAVGGGHFKTGFEADLTFLHWCVGVMVMGPLLLIGMMNLDGKQDSLGIAKAPVIVVLKVSLLVYK